MGFETDRFVENHIEDEFICSICQDVLKDPLLVETCEHLFCTDCIKPWIESHSTCPIDRAHIKSDHLRPPQRSFRDLLGKLKIYCNFATFGCSQVLNLEELSYHCANCDFNPDFKRECNSGCGAMLSMRDKEMHNCVDFLKDKLLTQSIIIEAQKKETEELRKNYFSNSTKMAIIKRARISRNNPTFFQNHMDKIMTQNVLEIAANSIAKIDHWWNIANDIIKKLDEKYGPYWGCCIASGMRNIAVTCADEKCYIDFNFDDLSVFIWKNAIKQRHS